MDLLFTGQAGGASNGVAVNVTGGPTSTVEGTAVALTASTASSGPSYSWSVTKDGAAFGATGTGPTFGFTPTDQGTYIATVMVTTSDGPGAANATVAVANGPPTATFGTNTPLGSRPR